MGIELPLHELFEAPTIAELARRLAEEEGTRARQLPPLLKANRDRPLALSFAQERLWFLHQLYPGDPTYNIPAALRMEGALRVPALSASLRELVRRHEVLRTRFAQVEGEPVQVISPRVELELAVVDLRRLPAAVREKQARGWVLDEAQRPFDLGLGQLLRVYLLRLSEEEHLLLFVMHHIASDGWSSEIFIRELTALYEAFCHGRLSPLPELAIQYADFASWQRAWLQGEALDEQLAYWRRQLDGAAGVLELPTDRPRPRILSSRGDHVSRQLSTQLSAGLRTLSVEREATLFMMLLAAYALLLARYSSQNDVILGSPTANRSHVEIEDLIGFFVNTLAFRIDLSGGGGFRELLDRVRHLAFDAYQHQDLPFEKLIDELEVERSLERTPLFQVFIAFQNEPAAALELSGLSLTSMEVDTETAKFDLTLVAAEVAGAVTFSLKSNRDLFDKSTAARMARHFETLLAGIAQRPEAGLDELPMMGSAERFQLFEEWNREAWSSRSESSAVVFHELFAEQVRRRGDKPAIRRGDRVWSYRGLDERSVRLAAHLCTLALPPEFRVGLHLAPSPALLAGILGTFKAGGAFVPLDPNLPEERLRFIADDAGIQAILSGEESPPLPRGLSRQAFWLDNLPPALSVEVDQGGAEARGLAYTIYTSGSTGQPKGVMVEHRSLLRYLTWIGGVLRLDERARIPAMTPLAFDASLKQLLAPLAAGAEVWLPEVEVAKRPESLLREIRTGLQPVALNCVPSLWTALLDRLELEGDQLNGHLRRLLLGGEVLSAELVERTCRTLPEVEIWNLYGPSEATANATACRVSTGRPVSLGRPIASTRVILLDRHQRPIALGPVGELGLGGSGLARGYLRRPGLTAQRFVPDPFTGRPGRRLYLTGDLARFLPSSGDLEFRGRIDHQVKVRGFRVELGEVEATLMRHPAVREAVVVAAGEHLNAYLVCQRELPDDNEVRDHLYRSLPEHMIPANFTWLEALPSTATGKVDRQALASSSVEPTAGKRRLLAPRNEVELSLAQIWQELLGTKPIGVDENFFRLGGSSLLSVRLVTAIERRLGVRLPLSGIFEMPTIERLASGLKEHLRPRDVSPLVVLRPEGKARPFFCVHPVGGNVFCYMELAHRLGEEQPFYGLQSVAPAAVESGSEKRLETMASEYLEALREIQPCGPYALGGWSMGGVVAFEMARQLEGGG